MSDLERGPYINADQDELYLPIADWSYNNARSEAASFAEEMLDAWGRSRYVGKRSVPLHDHEDFDECEVCPSVPAWCFELYEGTWRT